MADVAPVQQRSAVPFVRPSLKRRWEDDDESDDEPRKFRRVRIRCRQRAGKQSSQDQAEFEVPRSGTETIRCICGAQDDLGLLRNSSSHASSASLRAWLIQCVDCKAWHHRSCVGHANGKDPPGGIFFCGGCSKVKPTDGLTHHDVEEYIIKCFCGSDTDDGSIVYCYSSNTWQYRRCYQHQSCRKVNCAPVAKISRVKKPR